MEESTGIFKQEEWGGSETVLPEFMGFYMLLYAAYAW